MLYVYACKHTEYHLTTRSSYSPWAYKKAARKSGIICGPKLSPVEWSASRTL